MLHLTAKMFGGRHVIASIQGPNQFFLDAKAQQVGYGWITSRHAAASTIGSITAFLVTI